jgi:hypothetical protein
MMTRQWDHRPVSSPSFRRPLTPETGADKCQHRRRSAGEIGQVEQSCLRRLEPAGVEVEGREVVVEVDMQPFAARSLGVDGSSTNQFSADAGMLVDGTYLGIEEAWSPPSHATLTKPTSDPSS